MIIPNSEIFYVDYVSMEIIRGYVISVFGDNVTVLWEDNIQNTVKETTINLTLYFDSLALARKKLSKKIYRNNILTLHEDNRRTDQR